MLPATRPGLHFLGEALYGVGAASAFRFLAWKGTKLVVVWVVVEVDVNVLVGAVDVVVLVSVVVVDAVVVVVIGIGG